MLNLLNWTPSQALINFVVVVIMAVTVVSMAACIASKFLERHPAIRDRVLLSALLAILVSPLFAAAFIASGKSLVAIPLLTMEKSLSVSTNDEMPSGPMPQNPILAKSLDPVVVAVKDPLPTPKIVALPNEKQISAEVVPATLHRGDTEFDSRSIVDVVCILWLCGTIICVVGLIRSRLFLKRLRRSLQPNSDTKVADAIRLADARNAPIVMTSPLARTPLATGIFRPIVVLPVELPAAISRAQLRDVLVHEIAHIERLDNLVVLLQAIARALFWPIPFVHLLNRQLARAREDVCDNYVLASRDAVSYGETLLRLAQLACGVAVPAGTVGILHWRGKLEQRIGGLIHLRRSKTTRTNRVVAAGLLVSFLAASAVLSTITIRGARAVEQVANPGMLNAGDDPATAGQFSGRVTGPDGKPIANARIFVAPLSDDLTGQIVLHDRATLPVRAITGADGRFAFDAPDMTILDVDGLPTRRITLVMATADGFAPDWILRRGRTRSSWMLDPEQSTDLSLQLANDDVPIHGQLLDPEGRPLKGAKVRVTELLVPREGDLNSYLDREAKTSFLADESDRLRGLDQPNLLPGLVAETQSDVDGRFTLSGLGADRLASLRVTARSVVETDLIVMTRDAPDVGIFLDDNQKPTQIIHGATFTLQLKAGRTISGIVRDRDTHQPIPGMLVGRGWPGNFPRQGLMSDPVITDAQGHFAISGFDPAMNPVNITAISAPGMIYQPASVDVNGEAPIVIDAPRGIPFHLKLVDEQGKPVQAVVTSYDVTPNPLAPRAFCYPCYKPLSQAIRLADGSYQGFVVPGPGAVLVQTPGRSDFLPAYVDPKAFFAPGRTDWSAQDRITTFGTPDTLAVTGGLVQQSEYAAIVLVNPAPDSPALELSATVKAEKPRQVTLVDPDGKPVVGATIQEVYDYTYEPPLRAASFSLPKLHPDRVRPITFLKDDRHLIGLLLARGGDAPYTVQMQPWAGVTGRIVDANGKVISEAEIVITPDGPDTAVTRSANTDDQGRIRVEKLIPGMTYSAKIYRGTGVYAKFTDMEIKNLKFRAGEVHDLGDIRSGN